MVKKQLLRKMHPTRRLEAITVLQMTVSCCKKRSQPYFKYGNRKYKPLSLYNQPIFILV